MAKRIITESYVFNPSSRTVIIVGKYIRQEQLLLVTNVTQNTVIYNFSDPTLGYTSFSQLTTGSNESTTVDSVAVIDSTVISDSVSVADSSITATDSTVSKLPVRGGGGGGGSQLIHVK